VPLTISEALLWDRQQHWDYIEV